MHVDQILAEWTAPLWAQLGANLSDTVDLISYDDFDLQSLKKDGNLKKGSDLSKVYGNSNFVLATSDPDSTWKIGDAVHVQGETLTIAGLLKNDPFNDNGMTNGKITLISSSDTFARLIGEENYALIMVQTTSGATDEDVQAIQAAAGETFNFQDMRDGHTSETYTAFVFCVYAFLAIIALGCAVGCIIGLPLSKLLYDSLIAGHFPYAVWDFPIGALGIILVFVSLAAVAAIHAPAKRIRNMSITESINEL